MISGLIATETYGHVIYSRMRKEKVRTRDVYDPALWDALRKARPNSRQKRLLAKVRRRG